jgi:hypothetical protein
MSDASMSTSIHLWDGEVGAHSLAHRNDGREVIQIAGLATIHTDASGLSRIRNAIDARLAEIEAQQVPA